MNHSLTAGTAWARYREIAMKNMMTTMRAMTGVMMLGMAILGGAEASAAPLVFFGSDGGAGETNNLGDTIAISQHPGWANPYDGTSWVSYGVTGNPSAPGYTVAPNGTVINFYDSFFLPSTTDVAGWLRVMADDSAGVYVNGTLLLPEASQGGNTYATCSDKPIGCLDSTAVVLNITPLLQQGNNDLLFSVAQRAGSSLGLNYFGEVNQVPEPASMMLIGTGLIGIAARARKRFGAPRE
jgi:hypothetical protein